MRTGAANGYVPVSDVNGVMTWTDPLSSGIMDNLGNHTATENIQTTDFWLSNDGGDEGIFISDAGFVGIGMDSLGTVPLTEELSVNGDIQIVQEHQTQGRDGSLGDFFTEVRALEFYYPTLEIPFAKISAKNFSDSGTGWYNFLDRVDAGFSG